MDSPQGSRLRPHSGCHDTLCQALWPPGQGLVDAPTARHRAHPGPLAAACHNFAAIIWATIHARGHQRAIICDRSHSFLDPEGSLTRGRGCLRVVGGGNGEVPEVWAGLPPVAGLLRPRYASLNIARPGSWTMDCRERKREEVCSSGGG